MKKNILFLVFYFILTSTANADTKDKNSSAMPAIISYLLSDSKLVWIYVGRPSYHISSISLYMTNGDKTIGIGNYGLGIDGFTATDGDRGDPAIGYDRYLDSKWAKTQYKNKFNDLVLTTVPFTKFDGRFCNNTYHGDCKNNYNNFFTYYTLDFTDYIKKLYKNNF